MKALLTFWCLLIALTVARFLAVQTIGISADEAYYWLLGERWDWASFEGPGGVPALVAMLSASIGPLPEALLLFSPLCLLLASLGLWWWARSACGVGPAIWVVSLRNVLPVVNTKLIHFGVEAPLVMLWVWFWALCWKAQRDREGSGIWWLLASLTAAGGVLVSYAMVLAPLGLVLLFLIQRWQKVPIGTSHLWRILPIVLSLFALLGPLLWNIHTHFIAFAGNTFQTLVFPGGLRSVETVVHWLRGGGFLLPLLSLLLFAWAGSSQRSKLREPMLFAACLPAFFWIGWEFWRGGPQPEIAWLLFLTPLLVLTASCLFTQPAKPASPRVLKFGLPVGGAICALVSAVGYLQVADRALPVNWAQAAERMERIARIYQPAGGEAPFLIAGDLEAASALGFYLLGRETGDRVDFPPVYLKESQNVSNQFGLWPRYDQFVEASMVFLDRFYTEQDGVNLYLGKDAVYFGQEAPEGLPQVIRNGFARVYPLETLTTKDGRVFYVYFCEDYQTAPL